MLNLDDVLDRLLHEPRTLRAFVADGPDMFVGLAAGDRDALRAIDRAQLARAARTVRTRLIHRRHRGSGGVATLYPQTVARWHAAHPGDAGLEGLAEAFMGSDAFMGYREHSFCGAGACLEEAFYRFCEDTGVGDPAEREHEFLGAMVRALTVTPRPAFVVPAEIRRGPAAWYSVAIRADPVLYAATPRGMVTGAVTAFLRDLVLDRTTAVEAARKHGVSTPVLEASLLHLRQLGVRTPVPR